MMPELLALVAAAVAVVVAGIWSILVLWRKMQEIQDENHYLIAEHLSEIQRMNKELAQAEALRRAVGPKRKVIGIDSEGEMIFSQEGSDQS